MHCLSAPIHLTGRPDSKLPYFQGVELIAIIRFGHKAQDYGIL